MMIGDGQADMNLQTVLVWDPCIFEVDHWALRWLMTILQKNGRLARWALGLQGHNFQIRRRKVTFLQCQSTPCQSAVLTHDCRKPSVSIGDGQAGVGRGV